MRNLYRTGSPGRGANGGRDNSSVVDTGAGKPIENQQDVTRRC